MALQKGGLALAAMATVACLAGGLLGAQWTGGAASADEASLFLARFDGFASIAPKVALATLLAWGVTRCGLSSAAGGKTTLGPNAQLGLFHDGNALIGVALALAMHGSNFAWPLLFATLGRLLVNACQAMRLRRGLAMGAVWAYAGAALLLNSVSEGATFAYWCTRLPAGAATRSLPLAASLDRLAGVAPVHFTVGVAFRYTLMRFVSWALDTLSGRVLEATRPGAVERAFPHATDNPSTHLLDDSCSGDSGSPRIGAVQAAGAGASGASGAGNGASSGNPFDHPFLRTPPGSPQKLHVCSTAGLASASWSAFFSYLLFAPTYLAGPLLSASDYFQQAAAIAAGRSTAAKASPGDSRWRAVVRMAGFCAFAAAMQRSLLPNGVASSLLAAQPWHAFAVGYCALTALFAQSFVPWTASRLLAGMMGLSVPDEAPVGYLQSSASPARFWRNWHTSWYRWLRAYVYVPLGGTPLALVTALMVSTMLHGGNRAWLVWGAIQACALLAEQAARGRRWRLPGVHRHVQAALVQAATQTTLLVQLPLGPNLWRFLLAFHALNLPFLVANAARLEARAASAASRKAGKAGALSDVAGAASAKLVAAAKLD